MAVTWVPIDRLLPKWEQSCVGGLGHIRPGVHANDSKTAFGSRVDRHENIGAGEIGSAGFKLMLRDPVLRKLPFILETPGFDDTGPDLKNVRILRKLAGTR